MTASRRALRARRGSASHWRTSRGLRRDDRHHARHRSHRQVPRRGRRWHRRRRQREHERSPMPGAVHARKALPSPPLTAAKTDGDHQAV